MSNTICDFTQKKNIGQITFKCQCCVCVTDVSTSTEFKHAVLNVILPVLLFFCKIHDFSKHRVENS